MNNEILKLLEDCKDALKLSDDVLHEFLIKEIEELLSHPDEYNTTYIYETISLHQSNGELYVDYGTIDNTKTLVFNIDNLYKDLGIWINLVKKGNAEMQQLYKDNINKEIEDNHSIQG